MEEQIDKIKKLKDVHSFDIYAADILLEYHTNGKPRRDNRSIELYKRKQYWCGYMDALNDVLKLFDEEMEE
jgi:hypothetical protein